MSLYSTYRSLNIDKSDEELKAIINKSSDIALGLLRPTASPSELAKAEALKEEVKACADILKERETIRTRQKKGQEKLKGDLDIQRREKAILNLKHGCSPNGQFIAAILEEEDGKTVNELHVWCEELSEIDEKDLMILLDGLVEEKILDKREERYYLINICVNPYYVIPVKTLLCLNKGLTSDERKSFLTFIQNISELYSEDLPFIIFQLHGAKYMTVDQMKEDIRFMVNMCLSEQKEQILDIIGGSEFLIESLLSVAKKQNQLERILNHVVSKGYFSRIRYDGNNYYSLKLLGE